MKRPHLPPRRRSLLVLGSMIGLSALGPWVRAAQVAEGRLLRIGVIKFTSNAALNAAEKGFETALSHAGFREGIDLIYDRQDALGSMERAETIGQQFVSERVDLVHSMSTPGTQGVMRSVKQTPLVFSAVSDPVGAGIVPHQSSPGSKTRTHVTGVSHVWPVALQLEIYTRFVPKARVWGTIYNPAEPNSRSHVSRMREAMIKRGLTLIEVQVSHNQEVEPAMQSLVGRVQAIALAADNTAMTRLESIARVCDRHKIALFGGDHSSMGRGPVAAYGIDYTQIGYQAGKKAALVLMGVDVGDIPWGPVDKVSLVIDRQAARRQGVKIPQDMRQRAERILN
jgi:putative tryptophan/tyrosine transport system substrate-binding protein